jgi:hypothetical protein
VPWTTARGVFHCALYGECASSWVVHHAPRPVSTKIDDEQLVASRDGHYLVRVRALLAGCVRARASKLQFSARHIGIATDEAIWGRGGKGGS